MTRLLDGIRAMSGVEIAGQLIGIAAMLFLIFSFQFKRNRSHFLMQAAGSLLFCLHYALLGGFGGLAMESLNLTRAVILLGGEKTHRRPVLILQLAAAVGLTALIIALSEPGPARWLGLFPCIAQTSNLLGSWEGRPQKIRLVQLCAVSPAWMLYNCLLTPPSVGGILCESFNILSVLVYFFRVRILDPRKKRDDSSPNS